MKKIITMAIILLMIINTSSVAFGAVIDNGSNISPQFEYSMDVTKIFLINDGSASVEIKVTPYATAGITRATATVRIIKSGTGSSVKNWTNVNMSEIGSNPIYSFRFNGKHTLSAKGTYYAEYELKLYKGTVLKETITGTTASKIY